MNAIGELKHTLVDAARAGDLLGLSNDNYNYPLTTIRNRS